MFEIKFRGDGFDKVKKDLERLERRARELDGENSIPFTELFSSEFLKKYTNFSSLDEMFEKSGFKIDNQEDFEKIPDKEWDRFISENTKFATWKEILDVAGKEWITRKLFK